MAFDYLNKPSKLQLQFTHVSLLFIPEKGNLLAKMLSSYPSHTCKINLRLPSYVKKQIHKKTDVPARFLFVDDSADVRNGRFEE